METTSPDIEPGGIECRFGPKPVPYAKVEDWESRRAAVNLKRAGVTVPAGGLEERRAALLAAKIERGHEWAERTYTRQVAVMDRLAGATARASRRRRLCQVELFVPGGVAASFPAWFDERARAGDDRAMLGACPDHYLFRPTADGQVEVWETTGGSPLASRFFITEGDDEGLVTPVDPSFPAQMAGAARNVDGVLLGGVRHQFRNEDGGVRALLSVEFPWLLGPIPPAGHRWHLAAEFVNWLRASAAGPS